MEFPDAVGDDVVGLPNCSADEFMRRAVLEPLVGALGDAADLLEKTERVAAAWGRRAPYFVEAGALASDWGRKVTPRVKAKALARASACRPAFVGPTPGKRACGLSDICPFCWARAAAGHWAAIDRAFRLGQEGLRLRRALRSDKLAAARVGRGGVHEHFPHRLRVAEARASVARSAGHDLLEWSLDVEVPFQIESLQSGSRFVRPPQVGNPHRNLGYGGSSLSWVPRLPQATAMFESRGLTVEGERWHFWRRRLIMITAGSAIPEGWEVALQGGESTLHPRPSREAVMSAVVRACRYPAALLTDPDPQVVGHLIQSRRGVRHMIATGDFTCR